MENTSESNCNGGKLADRSTACSKRVCVDVLILSVHKVHMIEVPFNQYTCHTQDQWFSVEHRTFEAALGSRKG